MRHLDAAAISLDALLWKLIDSDANGGDSSARWNMIVGHAVVTEKTANCVKAFSDFKEALARHAKAQTELDAFDAQHRSRPMPFVEKEQQQLIVDDILGVTGTPEAESKIADYAKAAGARKRVQDAVHKSDEELSVCRKRAADAYALLVEEFAK